MKKNSTYYETPLGRLPRVTSILGLWAKPALMYWAVKTTVKYIGEHLEEIQNRLTEEEAVKLLNEAKKEADRIKNEAMDIGSRVHGLVERYLEEELTRTQLITKSQPDLEKPIMAFLEWQDENDFQLIEAEHTVWSKEGYAGTLDIVAELNGRKYIIDLKTSSGFWDEYPLQVAAYKKAYQEQTGSKIYGIGVLRLDKETGIPKFGDYTKEYPKAIKSFLYLCKFWHSLKRGEGNGTR